MFIHQTSNSVGNEIYNAFVYRNFNWQAHMHKSFEFVYVYEGELKAMVDGKSYSLHKNECLFVEPYCVHAYEYVRHCTCLIVVFSTSFVELFTRSINKKKAIKKQKMQCPRNMQQNCNGDESKAKGCSTIRHNAKNNSRSDFL